MVVQYIANDGTIFNTEAKCLDYEKQIAKKEKKFFQTVIAFDKNFNLINNFLNMRFVSYIYIKDTVSQYLIEEAGLEDFIPDEPGLWSYNADSYKWELATERLKKCQEQIQKYQIVTNNLEAFIKKVDCERMKK